MDFLFASLLGELSFSFWETFFELLRWTLLQTLFSFLERYLVTFKTTYLNFPSPMYPLLVYQINTNTIETDSGSICLRIPYLMSVVCYPPFFIYLLVLLCMTIFVIFARCHFFLPLVVRTPFHHLPLLPYSSVRHTWQHYQLHRGSFGSHLALSLLRVFNVLRDFQASAPNQWMNLWIWSRSWIWFWFCYVIAYSTYDYSVTTTIDTWNITAINSSSVLATAESTSLYPTLPCLISSHHNSMACLPYYTHLDYYDN